VRGRVHHGRVRSPYLLAQLVAIGLPGSCHGKEREGGSVTAASVLVADRQGVFWNEGDGWGKGEER